MNALIQKLCSIACAMLASLLTSGANIKLTKITVYRRRAILGLVCR